MKVCADCGPCLMKRILFQARLAGTGKEFEAVRRCMELYSSLMDPDVCSASIATETHRLAYSVMGCEDPYLQMKVDADRVAEAYLQRAEEFIRNSKDPFRAAVKVALAGNIMDFGSGIAIDSPDEFGALFEGLLAQDIGLDECDTLEEFIGRPGTVLYAFDNCGEDQLDRFLIREIRHRGKRVVGVVRGAPILNDVALGDALRIGLDRELDGIVSTGEFSIGFPREVSNEGFRRELRGAGLLIAKGMANYESLSEYGLPVPIAFLLRAKCLPVASSLNVPVGTNVVKIKNPERRFGHMEIKQVVIMVGGRGTRLHPLTDTVPKPALPVLDMPCLKYLIRSFADAGIEEVFLACGYRSDVLKKAIGDGSDLGVRIVYSDEDTPLGTGGAMKQLEPVLDPVFAAANGDTLVDIDLRRQIKTHFANGAKITIALTRVDNPCEYGIARLEPDGRITEFKDKPKPEEVFSDLINAGIYVVDRSVLRYVPEHSFFDFSKDLVPIITRMGWRVQGYRLEGGVWMDVGRPSDLVRANLVMAERRFPDADFGLGKDVDTVRPFYVGKGSEVARSTIDSSAVLDDCRILDSSISKSLIMKGCNVTKASVSGSILGNGCIVGEGAVIRDSVLRDGTTVPQGAVLDGRIG